MAIYSSRGLHHFYLGDEAIIHCDRFDIDSPAAKSVRQAARRVARDYQFRLVRRVDRTARAGRRS